MFKKLASGHTCKLHGSLMAYQSLLFRARSVVDSAATATSKLSDALDEENEEDR